MPRSNPTRTMQSEAVLARRIAYERSRRGWTLDGLAKRMTNAGCPIQGSAIYKIERADPPRRITVDELVALARVFELEVADLLIPVEFIEQQAALDLLDKISDDLDVIRHWSTRLMAHVGECLDLTLSDEVTERFTSLRREPNSAESDWLTPLPLAIEAAFKSYVGKVWRSGDQLARAGTPVALEKNA